MNIVLKLIAALREFDEAYSVPRKPDPLTRAKRLKTACQDLRKSTLEFREYAEAIKDAYPACSHASKATRGFAKYRRAKKFTHATDEFCFVLESWWEYCSPARLKNDKPNWLQSLSYKIGLAKKPAFFNQTPSERASIVSELTTDIMCFFNRSEETRWLAMSECIALDPPAERRSNTNYDPSEKQIIAFIPPLGMEIDGMLFPLDSVPLQNSDKDKVA